MGFDTEKESDDSKKGKGFSLDKDGSDKTTEVGGFALDKDSSETSFELEKNEEAISTNGQSGFSLDKEESLGETKKVDSKGENKSNKSGSSSSVSNNSSTLVSSSSSSDDKEDNKAIETTGTSSSNPSNSGITSGSSTTSGTDINETPNSNKKFLIYGLAAAAFLVLVLVVMNLSKGGSANNAESNNKVEATNKSTQDSKEGITKSDNSKIPLETSKGKNEVNQETSTTESNNNKNEIVNVGDVAPGAEDSNSISGESIESRVKGVFQGKYGSGAERKRQLGSDYESVQSRVNEILKSVRN
jgi:hypothetical protein